MKGIIKQFSDVFEEDFHNKRSPPLVRVEKMLEFVQFKLPRLPQFLLCLLPDRKIFELYGNVYFSSLTVFYCLAYCITPQRVNDHYLTNVLLKINAKLGGLNSILGAKHAPSIPIVSRAPTIVIGMDVSHGSLGQTNIPSIA
ncbi:hypothetical protein V8G54_006501 [Vigna mungo]|uniref:Piwi domain-containing protein n=1 Tax=Vigna mungo TaxID=3915 RepID=A0AAQ3S4L7_VIGMU